MVLAVDSNGARAGRVAHRAEADGHLLHLRLLFIQQRDDGLTVLRR